MKSTSRSRAPKASLTFSRRPVASGLGVSDKAQRRHLGEFETERLPTGRRCYKRSENAPYGLALENKRGSGSPEPRESFLEASKSSLRIVFGSRGRGSGHGGFLAGGALDAG